MNSITAQEKQLSAPDPLPWSGEIYDFGLAICCCLAGINWEQSKDGVSHSTIENAAQQIEQRLRTYVVPLSKPTKWSRSALGTILLNSFGGKYPDPNDPQKITEKIEEALCTWQRDCSGSFCALSGYYAHTLVGRDHFPFALSAGLDGVTLNGYVLVALYASYMYAPRAGKDFVLPVCSSPETTWKIARKYFQQNEPLLGLTEAWKPARLPVVIQDILDIVRKDPTDCTIHLFRSERMPTLSENRWEFRRLQATSAVWVSVAFQQKTLAWDRALQIKNPELYEIYQKISAWGVKGGWSEIAWPEFLASCSSPQYSHQAISSFCRAYMKFFVVSGEAKDQIYAPFKIKKEDLKKKNKKEVGLEKIRYNLLRVLLQAPSKTVYTAQSLEPLFELMNSLHGESSQNDIRIVAQLVAAIADSQTSQRGKKSWQELCIHAPAPHKLLAFIRGNSVKLAPSSEQVEAITRLFGTGDSVPINTQRQRYQLVMLFSASLLAEVNSDVVEKIPENLEEIIAESVFYEEENLS